MTDSLLLTILAMVLLSIPYFLFMHQRFVDGLRNRFSLGYQQKLLIGDIIIILLIWLPIEGGWAKYIPVFNSLFYPNAGLVYKFIVINLALLWFLSVRPLNDIGYKLTMNQEDRAWAAKYFVLTALVIFPIAYGTEFITFKGIPNPFEFLGYSIVIFLALGIPEELFFRGIIQNLLSKTYGNRIGLCLGSVIFGIAHANNWDWRYVLISMIAGLFYGHLYQKTKNICTTAIVHSVINAIGHTFFVTQWS